MKPSIPKGTRDFSSTEVAKRNYIFNTIKHSFENFGFQPIETPSFENSSTLMGKYGEEGDRLIFKILNSGDYLDKFNSAFTGSTFEFIKSFFLNLINEKKDVEHIINDQLLFLEELSKRLNFINETKNFKLEKIIDEEYLILVFKVLQEQKKQILKNLNYYLNLKENNDKIDVLLEEDKGFIWLISGYIYSLWSTKYSKNLTKFISEKALRYDLTVPFARYVVQHQNDITFPFKRYQIQPVWRADRPQKGRFREFYQCDADVVGSKSLLQEVEFIQLYDTVFSKLGLNGATIKINNRKILSGIAQVIGASDKLIDFTVALDKLDKIGKEGVVKEMLEKGISQDAIEKVAPLFSFSGTNQDKLSSLSAMLQASEEGLAGVEELRTVVNMIEEIGLTSASLELDVTLARGLNYYTGAIYEVAAPKEVKMGSIGGGGRYDDLTGIFGLKDVSGVGISFGLDRIYLVMEELNLFEAVELPKPRVLFLNFNEAENLSKIKAIKNLRENNIKSELYPDTATSNKQEKKQWKYVGSRGIEFVVTDVNNDVFVLKNMLNGEQTTCSLDELKKIIQ
ncbi:histidine--tRNA ligase [Tenacibaculum finnmarkense genomovar finnmarkense]|uniref:histidine--tRNA ligase n=1 Tax=Tenacibaculum finnmarkense TaxID=2781243 RepID=UPI001E2E22B9|nr:histidine--tRNA ligase [Tenacibaculum finnmarkense]MCD8417350.1 histidine--tRNA ligase [Tenacibaculum finnmarkense genomovar finnmarkense]MCG8185755.1 histidine--tRNA ligase [Tenacibaculum finnmarkense genomovar finnmarkense]MCG8202308.1 histidine--tRNA ligase [Tenacibaculum finnmarkense genomovar finnmarkense]MCG8209688.1 histidine--tRNA ligase [Tenacibaculum finnmarkense genomovar finnmarkense]MCG8212508.1 histidine--tRNA ligase [Tenacibaculum finnmarkense genomovar finnmarkense]